MHLDIFFLSFSYRACTTDMYLVKIQECISNFLSSFPCFLGVLASFTIPPSFRISLLHSTSITVPSSVFSKSSVPGGLRNCFAAEFLLKQLRKYSHASVMSSAVEGLAMSGLRSILNTETNNPNAFSTIRHTRDSL